jgi:uncharacterized protein (DUF433 family)
MPLGLSDSRAALAYQCALRSRLVATLSDVTIRQLWYWHNTHLIRAHTAEGARGYPRLYSWVDYMKVRAANRLLQDGMSTRRVRTAIEFLDREIDEWYLLPLHRFGQHVVVEYTETEWLSATAEGQSVIPAAVRAVRTLADEGPLGALRQYSEYIQMDPGVMGGNPVLRGTRIEPQLIFELKRRELPLSQIASAYHLSPAQMKYALEFGEALAA